MKQEYIYMNDELLATIIYKAGGGESILNADMDGDGAVGVDDYLVWYFNHYLAGDLSRDVNADGLLDTSDYNLVLNCALSGGTATGCFTASYSRSIYYAHNDHLGTPHLLTDEAGVVIWSASYDPFGEATVNDDLDGDGNIVMLNIRFPGQYYDAESGLHYNYFRYYDPETGRYITSDPIGLSDGMNVYLYVNANPLVFSDPSGLFKVHGNWCGPNHSGGFPKRWDEMDSIERSVALPPIDSLDSCCQSHDKEYSQCREQYPCDNKKRAECMKKADRKLSQCSTSSKGSSNFHERISSKLIEQYMSGSNPDGD